MRRNLKNGVLAGGEKTLVTCFKVATILTAKPLIFLISAHFHKNPLSSSVSVDFFVRVERLGVALAEACN
jgi:hypothetical protein